MPAYLTTPQRAVPPNTNCKTSTIGKSVATHYCKVRSSVSIVFSMADNGSVVLRPIGDVELWYADADDCTWRLPVHVEWKQDPGSDDVYGLVLPGVCFYQAQLMAITAKLARYSLEDREDRWLIPRAHIESLLHKAPGIHAEFYYDWPDKDHPPIPSHHGVSIRMRRTDNPRAISFTEYVAHEFGIPADVVGVVISAIADCGPRWLVKYRRSIDLGFVKLAAFPFRSNWKQIVLFKGRSKGLFKALTASKRLRLSRLTGLRLPAWLCSPQNIGLIGGDLPLARVDYCIEAISNSKFEKAVDEVERERMARGNYIDQYTKGVEHLYETIVDCLANYARKAEAAWAAVRPSGFDGSLAFEPTRDQRIDGVSAEDIPVDLIPTGGDFSVFAEKETARKCLALHPQIETMQSLSAVPSATHDLRKRHGDGDMGQPRPEGGTGLPLLHAGQGAGAEQSMLSCGSTHAGLPSRMDGA